MKNPVNRTVHFFFTLGVALTAEAQPAAVECDTLTAVNQTPNWVIVTIRDEARGGMLEQNAIAPFSHRDWKSRKYACGIAYQLRAEVRASEDRSGERDLARAAMIGDAYGPRDLWKYDKGPYWIDVDEDKPRVARTVAYPVVALVLRGVGGYDNKGPATLFIVTSKANPPLPPVQHCLRGDELIRIAQPIPRGSYHVKTSFGPACQGPLAMTNPTPGTDAEIDFVLTDADGRLEIMAKPMNVHPRFFLMRSP